MRNHSCAMANCCPSYERDNCQGCQHCNEYNYARPKNSVVEKLKELAGTKKKLEDDILDAILYSNNRRVTNKKENPMKIKNVIFNEPATIVMWADGTKTIVKCQNGDVYSKETGLAVAIAKKALGNKGNFNEVFKKWIPEYGKEDRDDKEEETKEKPVEE